MSVPAASSLSFITCTAVFSFTITFSLTPFLSLFTCFFLPLVCQKVIDFVTRGYKKETESSPLFTVQIVLVSKLAVALVSQEDSHRTGLNYTETEHHGCQIPGKPDQCICY